MNIFRRVRECVGDAVAYEDGLEAGQEWKQQGGGPVNDGMLHSIHVSRGIETSNPAIFNKGFTDKAGYQDSDDEE